jgi:hypothetical protein
VQLFADFAALQGEVARHGSLLRYIQSKGGVPVDAKNWDCIPDWPQVPLDGWKDAINALSSDPDAPLPD